MEELRGFVDKHLALKYTEQISIIEHLLNRLIIHVLATPFFSANERSRPAAGQSSPSIL
jgi:hypothetical protein